MSPSLPSTYSDILANNLYTWKIDRIRNKPYYQAFQIPGKWWSSAVDLHPHINIEDYATKCTATVLDDIISQWITVGHKRGAWSCHYGPADLVPNKPFGIFRYIEHLSLLNHIIYLPEIYYPGRKIGYMGVTVAVCYAWPAMHKTLFMGLELSDNTIYGLHDDEGASSVLRDIVLADQEADDLTDLLEHPALAKTSALIDTGYRGEEISMITRFDPREILHIDDSTK